MALVIAHAAFVVTGIAGDMTPGILARNVAARLADDERELPLIVEIGRYPRPDDIGEMAGLAVGKTAKHGRVRHLVAAGLLAMMLVVEPDTKDLVGVGDHRQPGDFGERMPRGLAGSIRGLGQGAGGNGGFQIRRPLAQDRAEIDDVAAVDETPAGGAVDLETCEL